MEFYERVSGARFHSAFIRPGGVSSNLPLGLIEDIQNFIKSFKYRVDEIEDVLDKNRIWKKRLQHIGKIELKDAWNLGFLE